MVTEDTAKFEQMDIDQVPVGTIIYRTLGMALGIVEEWQSLVKPQVTRRLLNNGRHDDRYIYRKSALYAQAKSGGPVFVKRSV